MQETVLKETLSQKDKNGKPSTPQSERKESIAQLSENLPDLRQMPPSRTKKVFRIENEGAKNANSEIFYHSMRSINTQPARHPNVVFVNQNLANFPIQNINKSVMCTTESNYATNPVHVEKEVIVKNSVPAHIRSTRTESTNLTNFMPPGLRMTLQAEPQVEAGLVSKKSVTSFSQQTIPVEHPKNSTQHVSPVTNFQKVPSNNLSYRHFKHEDIKKSTVEQKSAKTEKNNSEKVELIKSPIPQVEKPTMVQVHPMPTPAPVNKFKNGTTQPPRTVTFTTRNPFSRTGPSFKIESKPPQEKVQAMPSQIQREVKQTQLKKDQPLDAQKIRKPSGNFNTKRQVINLPSASSFKKEGKTVFAQPSATFVHRVHARSIPQQEFQSRIVSRAPPQEVRQAPLEVREVKILASELEQHKTEGQAGQLMQKKIDELKKSRDVVKEKFKIELEDVGVYEGEVMEGYMSGFGVLYALDKTVLYEGEFEENNFSGVGIMHNKPEKLEEEFAFNNRLPENWVRYEGLFASNKRQGYGELFFDDNSKFAGQFSDDEACGFGIFTLADGTAYSGNWDHGILESKN